MDQVFYRAIEYRSAKQENHYSGDGGGDALVEIENI
jgi:hypothetical protein